MFICFDHSDCCNYLCRFIYWDNFSVDKFFPVNSISCFSVIKLQQGVDLVIELFDITFHSNSTLVI